MSLSRPNRLHRGWTRLAEACTREALRKMRGRLDALLPADGRNSRRMPTFEALEQRQLLASTLIISEFMADNCNGILDHDLQRVDWIEIHNPTASSINLDGYYLTTDPTAADKWRIPAVNLAAGGYQLVFVSGKDHAVAGQELHTDFELDENGQYLALLAPDGHTPVWQYSPKFPSQLPDVSYGVTIDPSTTHLISDAATVRTLVPAAGSLGTTWTAWDFADNGWTAGKGGVGYDVEQPPPVVSGFTLRMVDIASGTDGYIDNIGEAIRILDGTAPAGAYIVQFDGKADSPVINHGDGGEYSSDLALPNGYGGTSADSGAAQRTDYALRCTANVTIPAGQWTINVNSDDGFQLGIPGVQCLTRSSVDYTGTAWNSSTVPADVLVFGRPRGPGNTFATFTVPPGAGLSTTITLDFYERGGGDEVELAVASGHQTSFSASTFTLLSDGLNGWSVKTTSSTPPPTYDPLIGQGSDLESQMYNKNATAYMRFPFGVEDLTQFDTLKLRIKYDDGFVAYLNGELVATRNAPGAPAWDSGATDGHPDDQALVYEEIDISSHLGALRAGNNVLAIHGLNYGAGSTDFLIYPLLDGIHTLVNQDRYFTTPTPGDANDPSNIIGYVQDTKFDHNRGFYDAPFTLSITTETPEAEIRYTINGSAPTATTGLVYTAPITISGTATVRAAAYRPGYISTDVDTQTYLFLDDVVRQSLNGQAPAGWPTSWGSNVVDYGLDPEAVNSPAISSTVSIGNTFYFIADDQINGPELWKSDGSAAGTVLVKDIYPGATGSYPASLTNVNGTLYFTATDPLNGLELWKSDGTTAGTVLVKDIYPGTEGSKPVYLTNVNNTLYFAARDGLNGKELWKSDGTAAGTVMIKDINPGEEGSKPANLTDVNGVLYFAATNPGSGTELWKSNGTAAGTVLVKDIYAGSENSDPSCLTNVNGTLYFAATDKANGNELWKSNGTAAGTVLVKDISPGVAHSRPQWLTAVASTLYFTANDPTNGTELWKSTGTAAGTVLVKDINTGVSDSTPYGLLNIGGTLYFAAYDAAGGAEPWKSDGTAVGTTRIKDVAGGASGSNPSFLTNVGGTLYFAAYDGTNGYELWKSNGTSAGTTLVKNINTGNLNSGPGGLTAVGTKLFFTAYDATSGTQLWKSDGTSGGTVAVEDLDALTPAPLSPEDLKAIPTFSIVMNLNDLFDSATGIYANARQDGIEGERPGSIELMYPDGTKGFQINAGIRIRGGYSRDPSNPKHAFRFFFRDEYGGRLNYPVFGDDAAQTFEKFDLRCAQNYSWSYGGDSRGIFIRDQFSRDTLLAMGQPATRGNFYHLYINGQYWGLYDTEERPEAYFGETYLGGDEADYDVIKVETNGYTIYATDGNMDAWSDMWNQAKAGLATDAAYQRIQGNNPDGKRNSAYPVLLDVDNLIDYMLVVLYSGNFDAPVSAFLGNASPNNFFAIRDRNGDQGFQFINHDNEHTMLLGNTQAGDGLTCDRTGPFSAGDSLNKSNPQWFWQQCMANAEFRLRVADHVQKAFFNGGVLTVESVRSRFLASAEEIDRAVAAESARWGDSKTHPPLTLDYTWVNQINAILNTYIPQRSGIVLNQLKADNLYPSVQPPSFSQQGGPVSSGFTLTMSAPGGTVYYTLDGSDPRLMGGAVSPAAAVYTSAVPLSHTTRVRARVLSGGVWSAMNEAMFSFDLSALRITELMYHPADPPPTSTCLADDFEFVEFRNTASSTLNLLDVKLAIGIDFTFPNMTLAPGERTVVVRNQAAFEERYGTSIPIAGVYNSGNLSNSGEQIQLSGPLGQELLDFTYSDGWHPITDGEGYSLVVIDPAAPSEAWSDNANWRPSNLIHGAPGAADPGINPNSVVINEILTHTDMANGDWIELYNTTGGDIDISGWFLSDSDTNLRKYVIQPNTIIPTKGFLVFNQLEHFGTAGNPGVNVPFAMSELGESIFLSNSDGAGNAAGYRESHEFGASEREVTFGWYIKSTGGSDFVAMSAPTPRVANALPMVGPVVINELMYAPPADGTEFIELYNLTGASVPLYDPLHPANTWQFTNGVAFAFLTGSGIPAFGYALVVPIDPAIFRSTYSISPSVPIYGPYTGVLDHAGEVVELSRPGEPELDGYVPYIVVDKVKYGNSSSWPTQPNGAGPSLARVAPGNYGNDVANWAAEKVGGSPGLPNFDTGAPTADVVDVVPDPRHAPVTQITLRFSEPVFGFDRGDLTLSRDGGGNLLTASQTLTTSDNVTWILGNLSTLTGTAGNYLITLKGAGSGITDTAGNAMTVGATDSFTVDTTAPTVQITALSPDPRNTAVASVTIVFSESVTGFNVTDLTLQRSSEANLLTGSESLTSNNGTTWTLSDLTAVTAAAGSYVLTLNAVGSGIEDAAGNALASSASESWTVDTTAPTVSIAPVSPDPRSTAVDSMTITFSEPVSGFGKEDLTLTRDGVAVALTIAQTLTSADNKTWTLGNLTNLTTPEGTYVLTLVAAGSGITDAAGNGLAFGVSESWLMDTSAPSATVNQALSQADPTNGATVHFTVVFGEPVAGFTGSDVMLSGTGHATTAIVSGNGAVYDVAVSGMTSSGTVIASIAAGAAADPAGNLNTASTSTDNTVIYDTSTPTVIITPVSPDPRNTAVTAITIVFSEPVSGFDLSDLELKRGSGDNLLDSDHSLTSADGITWTLSDLAGITAASGSYVLTLHGTASGIKDLAGNALAAGAGETWVTDTDAPTATIAAIDPDPRVTPVASVQISFSDRVFGFDLADLTLTRDGQAVALTGATLSTDDSILWTLGGLSGLTSAEGAYVLSLNAIGAGITDSAGNPLASGASETWTTDTTAPAVSIAPVTPDPRNTSVGSIAITFSEAVWHFGISDLTLTRDDLGVALGSATLTSADGIEWTLGDLAGLTASQGAYVLTLPATGSGIADAAGNALASSASESWTVDTTAPTVSITPVSPDPRNTSVSSITIEFSEAVSGLDLEDLVLSRDGQPDLLTAAQTLSSADGITWTLGNLANLTSVSGACDLALKAAGSGIVDTAANALQSDASETFIVDMTAPTADIVDVAPDPRQTPIDSITILFDKPVVGFDLSDLILSRDGGPDLLTPAQSLHSDDGIHWVLEPLSDLTSADGTYQLMLNAAGSGIVDSAGNALATDTSDSWTVYTRGSLAGHVFQDNDADSVQGPTDRPLAAWTVFLDANNNGSLDAGEQSTQTGATGAYQFDELLPGLHVVRQVLIPGYTPVSPVPAVYTVNLQPGGHHTSADFANFPTMLQGTDAADSYYIRLASDGTTVEIYRRSTPSGTPDYRVARTLLPSLAIAADAGDDLLTVDFSGGDPVPSGGLSVDGGSGSNDRLRIIGTAQADNVSIDASRAVFGAAAIAYTGLEAIEVAGASGDDTLSINAALPFLPSFVAGSGDNTLTINAGAFRYDTDLGPVTLAVAGVAAVDLGASQHLAGLNITGSARVNLTPAAASVLLTDRLLISDAATLDLADNDLIVRAPADTCQAVYTQVSNWVRIGRGASSGGITSSNAADHPMTGLAVVLNDRGGANAPITARLAGEDVLVTDILVKYTWNGDTNLDGLVNADDYFLMDSGFLSQKKGWYNGDFNYDGVVNADDYFLIDSAFIGQGAPLAEAEAPAVLPELAPRQTQANTQPVRSVLSQLFSTQPLLQ